MKLNGNYNISFQKILRAKCNVIKNRKTQKAEIYELEPDKDKNYYDKIKQDTNWDKDVFADILFDVIEEPLENEISYVIEDKSNNKCIGYCIIDNSTNSITHIETVPKNLTSYQYIGETLLTFLAKKTKTENKPNLFIKNYITEAVDFYTNCFFKITDSDRRIAEFKKDFTDLLEWLNNVHTGKKFDYLG